ncbi:MAG: tRNA lysidine(34) synthetase TilS, partial [Mangrovibacterium sp.]
MIDRLRSHIQTEKLFAPGERIILAVSGGADSMVMLGLFRELEVEIAVAHCNFRLRGAESEEDEVFLRDFCGENGLELYVRHFDTREHAVLTGMSVEMAARQLRYDWFEALRQQLAYDYVATAHHQDDLIETMLINLSRGTGIRGLTGIASKAGRLIRPMLFASRRQILEYAARKRIAYRNDSSNEELLYQRNVIRHLIIPRFEEMNPAFRRNALRTAMILRDTEQLYRQRIDELRKLVMSRSGTEFLFSIARLKSMEPAAAIL